MAKRSFISATVAFLGLLLVGCASPTDADSAPISTSTAAASAAVEVFEYGDFALYVPDQTAKPHAVLVALGGPDTRAIVTGKGFGAPNPVSEANLQTLGADLRTLAADTHIAILGTRRARMANTTANDAVILDALATGAVLSGRSMVADAPVLFFGISGGGPESSGFTARHPERVAGLFLRVPSGVEILSGDALNVPTYMALHELDTVVNNTVLKQSFATNRSAGGYWGMSVEPGVTHFGNTPAHRQLIVTWFGDVMHARLRGASGLPVRDLRDNSGWFGDPTTGDAVPAGSTQGDFSGTSWLPSAEVAEQWAAIGGL